MSFSNFSTTTPQSPAERKLAEIHNQDVAFLFGVFDDSFINLDDPDTKEKIMQSLGRVGTEILDWDDETLLIKACINQHPTHVDFLLAQGANIHAHGSDDNTPLHHAARCVPGHDPIRNNGGVCVRTLLAHGADIEAENEEGMTPLAYCLEYLDLDDLDFGKGLDTRGIVALIEGGACMDQPVREGLHACYDSLSDMVLDPDADFPQEIVDCVRSRLSKRNLVEGLGDTQAQRVTKRGMKL